MISELVVKRKNGESFLYLIGFGIHFFRLLIVSQSQSRVAMNTHR